MTTKRKREPTDTERLDKLQAMAKTHGCRWFQIHRNGSIDAFHYKIIATAPSIRAAIDAAPEPGRSKR